MRRTMMTVLAVAMTVGCTTIPDPQQVEYEIDKQRVAAIEAAARQAGVEVIWINAPRRPIAN